MSDSDWDDIDIVVARDDHGSSSDPLVAAAATEREHRVMLLLEGKTTTATAAGGFDDDAISKGATASSTDSAPKTTPALLATLPARTRSCAFVGAHLHGKSRIVRDLVGRRNNLMPSASYDRQRGLTTALCCQSGVICGTNAPEHRAPVLFTAADAPGHPNFSAELPPAILLAQCAALVVDAVEGVTTTTERCLDAVVSEGVPLFLIISKLDRILVELRIPPGDAYKKLRHIVDSVNVLLAARGTPPVSPCHGTVVFLSSKFNVALTVPIAARRYREQFGPKVNVQWLQSQLWGAVTFDNATRKFQSIPSGVVVGAQHKPSFVAFILEPLYKAMVAALRGEKHHQQPQHQRQQQQQANTASQLAQIPGYNDAAAAAAAAAAAVAASTSSSSNSNSASVSIINLIKERVANVFGSYAENLPDAILEAMDFAEDATKSTTTLDHQQQQQPFVVSQLQNMFGMPAPVQWHRLRGIAAADARNEFSTEAGAAPFGVIAGKMRLEVEATSKKKVTRTFAILRLISGRLSLKQPISVYSGPDAEMLLVAPRMLLLVLTNNELMPVRQIAAGAVVLVDFEDQSSNNGDGNNNNNTAAASIISELFVPSLVIPENRAAISELLPVTRRHDIAAQHCKIALEPINIKELQRLREIVDAVSAERNGITFSVDDTGDLVLSGAGEVQLDAVLYDVRRHVAIRCTAPFTAFSETIVAEPVGILRRHTEQQHGGVTFSCFASPLGAETSRAVTRGVFHDVNATATSSSRTAAFNLMRGECGWDLVDCDTFVDVVGGTCCLFADSKEHVSSSSSSNINNNAYRWAAFGAGTAVRRGPLCDEPVRGVAFTLVDMLFPSAAARQQSTVTACARNVVRKAILSAAPRLMEPVMEVHVTLPQARVGEITEQLRKRRGAVLDESPIPATTWTVLKGLLPLADSFGFETAVRVSTQGDAFPTLLFRDWALVPGDPLDSTLRVNPYEPASGVYLARDFVMKTRKRKGLPDKIELN